MGRKRRGVQGERGSDGARERRTDDRACADHEVARTRRVGRSAGLGGGGPGLADRDAGGDVQDGADGDARPVLRGFIHDDAIDDVALGQILEGPAQVRQVDAVHGRAEALAFAQATMILLRVEVWARRLTR